MEGCTEIDTRDNLGQDLERATKTAISDNSRISTAQSEVKAANKAPAIRKELLDKLLSSKVAFKDVRRHGLSNAEMEYLYMADIVSKREYLEVIIKRGRSRRTAYRMWWKEARRSLKNFDHKPFSATITVLKKAGANAEAEKWKAWLEARCAGGIPAREIFFSTHDYVIDLLGLVRDELYNKETFGTKEVAEMLGVSPRHVRRLAQKGALKREGRGMFSKEQVAEHLIQQAENKINVCLDLRERLAECKDSRGDEPLGELLERYLKIEHLITALPKSVSGHLKPAT
jgi:hypothetical protein